MSIGKHYIGLSMNFESLHTSTFLKRLLCQYVSDPKGMFRLFFFTTKQILALRYLLLNIHLLKGSFTFLQGKILLRWCTILCYSNNAMVLNAQLKLPLEVLPSGKGTWNIGVLPFPLHYFLFCFPNLYSQTGLLLNSKNHHIH